jgi:hypothetical protein
MLLLHAKTCQNGCVVAPATQQVLRLCPDGRRIKLAAEDAQYAMIPDAPESPIAKALREELQRLLEKPLTILSVRKIGRVVEATVKTLKATSSGVEGLLDSKPKGPGYGMFNPGMFNPGNQDPDALDLEDGGGIGSGPEDYAGPGMGAYVSSPPVETFGTSSFREIASTALKFLAAKNENDRRPKIDELGDALAKLKTAGFSDDDPVMKQARAAFMKAMSTPEPSPSEHQGRTVASVQTRVSNAIEDLQVPDLPLRDLEIPIEGTPQVISGMESFQVEVTTPCCSGDHELGVPRPVDPNTLPF